MKHLGKVSLILGLVGLGFMVYMLAETLGNYEYMEQTASSWGRKGYAWLEDYRSTIRMQSQSAVIGGGLAVITGAISFAKAKDKLGIIGLVLGAASIGIAFGKGIV